MLKLDGAGLTPAQLVNAASSTENISITKDAADRIAKARSVVEAALERGDPVYGLNTGLGARVKDDLTPDMLADFSVQTIRGRAHAVGAPLDRPSVRAAMIVRLNTLCIGGAGASPDVAHHLAACLNAGLTPKVGETASVGAGDLCWNASLALSLIGEAEMYQPDGNLIPAARAMESAGISPLKLHPKDGLVLANHSSFTGAIAAIAIDAADRLIATAQCAAALTMEAMRANLTPLDPHALALRPLAGELSAATGLHHILAGSSLNSPGTARRLQDPLSIRNVTQIHGAAYAAHQFANDVVMAEINGSSDNPLVLLDQDRLISAGAYHTSQLTLGLEMLARALSHLAMAQLARFSKLLSPEFSGLPLFLARPGANSNGFAPVCKIAEALMAEILLLATPAPIWPSISAAGAEDCLTNAPAVAKNLRMLVEKAERLTAIELLAAAEALEQADITGVIAPILSEAHDAIRAHADPIDTDRPLGADIERIAVELVRSGALAEADVLPSSRPTQA